MRSISKRIQIVAACILIAAVAGAAGSFGSAGSATAAGVGDCTPGADWGTVRTDLSSSVVSLVNSHRAGLGLVALKVSPTLSGAAVWKARHMAKYSYLQHADPAPPVARTVADRLAACGYPSNVGWGENIAAGYTTASSVVNAWLNSAGHRANIENASYRATGVGAAASASGAIYWSQEFGTYDDSGSGGGGGGGGASAPTVTLTSGPASTTTSTSASFAWATTGSPTSTTCSLDGAAATACSAPASYSGLAAGTHTFRVTVSNTAGSAGATASWTISTTPPPSGGTAPTVRFTSIPRYVSGSGTFAWSTTGTVTRTTCAVDGGAAAACSSPYAVSGLARGYHRLTVQVTGPGGSAATAATFWVY